MANMAEETQDARRTMPLAIVTALVVAGALYSAVVLVVMLAVPADRLAASETPLSLVLGDGGWASPALVSAIAVIATTNGVLVEILMVSRLTYGMARRGWAPAGLGRIAPGTRTPVRATLLGGAAALALTVSAPVEILASVTSALLLLVFGVVNLALWRLHRAPPPAGLGFKAPRWVPPAGCASSFGLVAVQIIA
jgi:amino acid transporter